MFIDTAIFAANAGGSVWTGKLVSVCSFMYYITNILMFLPIINLPYSRVVTYIYWTMILIL